MLKRDKIIFGAITAQLAGLSVFGLVLSRAHSQNVSVTQLTTTPAQILDVNRPTLGAANAPYTLVEFGDYQCPPCAAAHPKVMDLLAQHPTTLRFQFRNLPLRQIHPLAERAATVAETAGQRGDFWRVHNTLYEKQSLLSMTLLNRIARLGTGDENQARRVIEQDLKVATVLKVEATPTFLLCTPDRRVLLLHSIDQAERILPSN